MEYPINFEQESSLFQEMFNYPSEYNPKLSKENEPLLFPDSFIENKSKNLSSFSPKKTLFTTKKIKTSFTTYKVSEPTLRKKVNNNILNGRWTRLERIKFAYSLYKYGTDWKKMKEFIATRSIIQLRSHAQKFLDKLKWDKFIVKKGLDFKTLNWQQSIQYLKEKLTEQEFFNVLFSIETELGDNNRMTEKYLERKRIRLKENLNNNDESLFSSNSTFDENSGYKCNEEKDYNINNNNKCNLLNLEEDNHFEKNLSMNDCFKEIINIFDSSNNSNNTFVEENIFSTNKDDFGYKRNIYFINI